MGLQWRHRIPLGRWLWLNLSLSGISVSARRGRVTANSRGSVWVRLAPGLSWRGRWR